MFSHKTDLSTEKHPLIVYHWPQGNEAMAASSVVCNLFDLGFIIYTEQGWHVIGLFLAMAVARTYCHGQRFAQCGYSVKRQARCGADLLVSLTVLIQTEGIVYEDLISVYYLLLQLSPLLYK